MSISGILNKCVPMAQFDMILVTFLDFFLTYPSEVDGSSICQGSLCVHGESLRDQRSMNIIIFVFFSYRLPM